MEKTCRRCGILKDVVEFGQFRHPNGRYYYRSQCKPCAVRTNWEFHQLHPEKNAEYRNNKTRKNPRALAEYCQKNYWKNVEDTRWKAGARRAVRRAISTGALSRPTACQHCGTTPRLVEAHHADYNKPLDVMWLCTKCHHALERSMGVRP